MRSFLTANDRAFKTVQILGGPRTRAVIQPVGDQVTLNDQFLTPKQVMRVRPDSLIKAGQVLIYNGDHYLVGDLSTTSEWQSFVLFHCDRQVDWERSSTGTDPTTGLATSSGALNLQGQPWVYWERVLRAPYDNTTRIPNIDYIVATGEMGIQKDDLIGGRSIVRYDTSLGLLILGVKE
jgi:hypothetical protein